MVGESKRVEGLGRARRLKFCPGCRLLVDREDVAALRMPDGRWHRECWLKGSEEREEALRSQRRYVGRHRALADYLLSMDQVGGLPGLIVGGGDGLELNLVAAHISQDGLDNDCYPYLTRDARGRSGK